MSMFEQAKKRPQNYNNLSSAQQWDIDKALGILDWDGKDDRIEMEPTKTDPHN